MSFRVLCTAVVSVCAAGAFLMFGCVDKDPIITGNRDAAAPVSTVDAHVAPATVVPQPDDPSTDVDAVGCKHCGETLSTSTARGTLCRKNGTATGKSSVERLNTLVDCICYDKCVAECTSYCAGSTLVDECSGCLLTGGVDGKGCQAQLNDCSADVVTQ